MPPLEVVFLFGNRPRKLLSNPNNPASSRLSFERSNLLHKTTRINKMIALNSYITFIKTKARLPWQARLLAV